MFTGTKRGCIIMAHPGTKSAVSSILTQRLEDDYISGRIRNDSL